MVIIISDEIIEPGQENLDLFSDFLEALSVRLRVVPHFLYFSRTFFEFVHNADISERLKHRMLQYHEMRNDTRAIMELSKIIFHITPCAQYKMSEEEGLYNIYIPYINVCNNLKLDVCTLFAEICTDAQFYSLLGHRFIKNNGLNNCVISCTNLGGGGGNIDKEFKQMIANKDRIVLCILDGDCCSPCDEIVNPKYELIKQEIINSSFYVSFVEKLESKCIDSIFPSTLVEAADERFAQVAKLRELQRKILASGDITVKEAYKFIKLSSQMKLRAVKYYCEQHPDKAPEVCDFWEKFTSTIELTGSCKKNLGNPLRDACIFEGRNNHKCEVMLVSQIRKLTEEMVDVFKENIDIDLSNEPFTHIDRDWNRIGELVFSFFCAIKRLPLGAAMH